MCAYCQESCWDSARFGHWELWLECISRYWELIIRGGDEIRRGSGERGSQRGGKQSVFTKIRLVPWHVGQEEGEATAGNQIQSWVRLRHWI